MNPTNAKKILITGAAGFIASKTCEMLLDEGREVVGVDNMNDAYDVRLKDWRLSRLKGRENFRFERMDISDRKDVADLFSSEKEGFEAVINLAARAGVRQSVENPWIYYDTNATGTLNLLEECRTREIRKFVLASTSSLYGSKNPMPFREDADTNHPLSPYAASKKAAETICYTYHYLYDLDITVFRYFTVYGPAGRPDMSLFRFTQWISEARPVIVFGDGTQGRDFTYVDDIVRGTIAGLKPLGYEVINLGGDEPVVLKDAISIVEKATGKKAKIEYQPMHKADMMATWADINKAKKLLGWSPQTNTADGIAKLVSWYQENREWAKEIKTE